MNASYQLGRKLLFRRNISSLRSAPKISASELRDRRAKLIENILVTINENNASSSSMEPLVFAASQPQTFNAPDVPHVFRQCSNFRYLTGFGGVDAAKILISDKRSILFIDERSSNEILWHGNVPSIEEIRLNSGVDAILPLSEFESYLASTVRANTILSVDLTRFKRETAEREKNLLKGIPARIDLLPEIDKLRWIKSAGELALMRDTCLIGAAALNATIAQASAHTNESHLVGLLEFEARRRGAQFLAYPPVVAAGKNANTIHYISAKEDINLRDCVLVDAGCDLDGYVSDITRCFPISGQFSKVQSILYEALRQLHEDLLRYVNEVRPLRLNELYLHMLRRMGEILVPLNFFTVPLANDELMLECDKLCPHHVSHYLGMDVHDSPTVPRHIPLLSGVVITVEPGIYVSPDNKIVHEEFRGIGFRIEDDLLITNTGSEVLTADCIRNANDIEELMRTF